MSDLENRVVKLEVITDNHDDDIRELRETSIDMKATLHSIEKNLNQIKYLVMGGAFVIVAQTIGLDHAISLLFKG